jgi:MoaA/NifB/PqqE/SkfB family radical SAM enzyme
MHYRQFRNRLLFKPAALSKFPQIIQIETNSFCSGSCLFCPYDKIRGRLENKLLPSDIYKKIVDECALYDVKILYLCLMNDPLTDKRIVDLINYTKTRIPDAQVKIITNVELLSHSMADSIVNSKLDELRFSFHGWTSYAHSKVMGLDFNKALQNLTYLLEKNNRSTLKIGIVCVKTKYLTKRDYYLLYDFCKKYKIDFGLSHICNMAGNLDINNAKDLGLKIIKKTKLKGCVDNWPLISIQICYDGKAVACCMDWNQEVILGNVYENSIFEIWNSQKYREFREMAYGNRASGGDFICRRCSESI